VQHFSNQRFARSSFETSSDISSLLREQLASLFQRLLIEDQNRESRRMFEELKASLATAGELVKYLTDNNQKNSDAISQILTSNHPIFAELSRLLKYRPATADGGMERSRFS
jgi:hypothetical protein